MERSVAAVDQVGTVEKAVDVLFFLQVAQQPQGVTDIGRALGAPKSSVHRLLTSLKRKRLVERDDHGRYRLGSGLIALGLGALDTEPLVDAARSVLEGAAEDVGETFFLVAARAGELIVLDKAEGNGFLRAAPRVGSSLPLHATAVGKLFLALAPDELAVATSALEPFTPQTITQHTALDSELEVTRAQGWAINRDEWIVGLSVIAAPVQVGDRLHGAVALAASTPRIDALGIDELVRKVVAAADFVANRLSGREV
jgi:IclR family acetate operon transcriptional repressor